jgi:hypothetical protein
MYSPGDVRVVNREDPKIIEPTDAIIKLSATCICGSDLWPYRGIEPADHQAMGHEYVGVVEEIGSDVKTMKVGDFVVESFVVTRAVLPVVRKQRSGHIISISSSAGLVAGFDFMSAYAASKLGLEGWMESLAAEVAPFGIHTTIVNPGFFRTELLTEQSTNYAEPSIADYDERRGPLVEYWKSQNGRQSGDPTKLARALITIASQDPPPRRFIAGADAIATAEQKITDLKTQIDANRVLSTSLAFDEERPRA